MRRTFIYVDGLNLYYRAARPYNVKWLNIQDLCKRKLHCDNEIIKIKYFTSIIKRSSDPSKHVRQQLLIRALSTLPNLDIIKGTFRQQKENRVLADNPYKKVKVLLTEEKGSDVNLAVNMVHDAHLGLYDIAIVLSNDSNLIGAVKIVKGLDKLVGILCPSEVVTEPLKRAASFTRILNRDDLRASEFPKVLQDCKGVFHRPNKWD